VDRRRRATDDGGDRACMEPGTKLSGVHRDNDAQTAKLDFSTTTKELPCPSCCRITR
jgi:hypothetical protein